MASKLASRARVTLAFVLVICGALVAAALVCTGMYWMALADHSTIPDIMQIGAPVAALIFGGAGVHALLPQSWKIFAR